MIDEAFMPFSEIINKLSSFKGEIYDEANGQHSYIYEFEIDSPVELDVYRDEEGQLHIGSTPPLYYVYTTIRPSFHKLTFRAEKDNMDHGN